MKEMSCHETVGGGGGLDMEEPVVEKGGKQLTKKKCSGAFKVQGVKGCIQGVHIV